MRLTNNPETGEGVEGEKLSRLRTTSEDFPSREVDLGRTHPDLYDRESQEHDSPVETLPERVSPQQIQRDAIERDNKRYGGGV
jgi:hypothetical protein